MTPLDLAVRLRDAGLVWKPAPGDLFAIPDRDMDDEFFVLSDMTIQVYELAEGPVLGFNGTVEWALDDLAQEEAVWLPREDQLRELLGTAFSGLSREGVGYRVAVGGRVFRAGSAARAYGEAVLDALVSGPSGSGGAGR